MPFRRTPFAKRDAYELAREAVSQAFLLLLGGELEGAKGMVAGAVQNFAGAMIAADADRLMRTSELIAQIGVLAREHVGELSSLDPCASPKRNSSKQGTSAGGENLSSSSPGRGSGEEDGEEECPVKLEAKDPAEMPDVLPLERLLRGFASNPERPDAPSPLQDLLEGSIRDPFLLPVAAKAAKIYPANLLLYGPGGTGKTELSRALARDANLWYIEVGSADIKSKWVGQADKCLRKLIRFAEKLAKETRFADEHELDPSRKNGVLVFVDEIDGLLGEDEGNDSNLGNVVTAFKTEVQPRKLNPKGVILVGATNRPWTIRDRSVVQRFGVRAYLGLPTAKERAELFLSASASYAREDIPGCFPPKPGKDELIELAMESAGMSRREIDDFVRQTFSALPVGLSHYADLKYCPKDGGLTYFARARDAQGDKCDDPGYGTWEELFESRPDASGKAFQDPEKIERQSRICWPAPTASDLLQALRSGKFVKSTTVRDLEKFRQFAKDQSSDAEAFLVRLIDSEIQDLQLLSNRNRSLGRFTSSPAYTARGSFDREDRVSGMDLGGVRKTAVSDMTQLLSDSQKVESQDLEPETALSREDHPASRPTFRF